MPTVIRTSLARRRRAPLAVALVAAVSAASTQAALFAQDLEPVVADFWAANSAEETDGAVERILALDPDIESLWPLMRAGGAFAPTRRGDAGC